MLWCTRSTAYQLLSELFISCSIVILVSQSLAFCKFTGQGRDLILLLNFLLQYCRIFILQQILWLLFFIYLFVYFLWFTLLQLVWFFIEEKKNSDRHLFSVKCKYKSVIVILYFNFSIFSTNSWHFFYCVTTSIFTKQCNSRWNTSNHQVEQKKQKNNKNWPILMSSQKIILLLCSIFQPLSNIIADDVTKFFREVF